MKTSDPYAEACAQAARAAERCQYHTPTGRQCACLIEDPQSKLCPESPSTDTQNFADLLAESAEDFQTAGGINHSLAHLFRLLAGGQISTRRATGLAYIASLLLRTLPAINNQLAGNESTQFEIVVPPDEPTMPEGDDPQACLPAVAGLPRQGFAPVEHAPEQPTDGLPIPATPLSNFVHRSFPSPLSPRVPSAASHRRTARRGGPACRGRLACRDRFRRHLAPQQLRLARLHFARRQADRTDLFRRFLLQTLVNILFGEFVDRRDVLSLICEAV